MKHEFKLSIAAACVFASAASAQITNVAPFTGTEQEEFENVMSGSTQCDPTRIFANHGDACTPQGNYLVITFGWLLYCAIYPHNGSNGLAGSSVGPFEYTFDTPAQRFGGYFGTNGYLADGWAEFYDVNNALIGTKTISAPKCAWSWNGWDAGAGPAFKRVLVFANDPYNGGALMQMDDMEIDFANNCAAPSTYCTAKVNSKGCTPHIGSNGTPSATSTSPFKVTGTNLINNKVGLLFYGHQVSGAPFQGGYLCMKLPITRTTLQNSGGTASGTDCSGNYSFDFNAWIKSGGDPSLTAGSLIFAQYWARDPADPTGFTTSLTNGLVFQICP